MIRAAGLAARALLFHLAVFASAVMSTAAPAQFSYSTLCGNSPVLR